MKQTDFMAAAGAADLAYGLSPQAITPVSRSTGGPKGIYEEPNPTSLVQMGLDYFNIFPRKTTPLELESALTGDTQYKIREEAFGTGPVEEYKRVSGEFLNAMTFGISGAAKEFIEGDTYSPETLAGGVAGKVAGLGGLIAGPFGVAGKIVGPMAMGTRLMPTANGLIRMAELATHGAATLGLANTMSAVLPAIVSDQGTSDKVLS